MLQFVDLPFDVIFEIARVHWKVWYKLSISFRDFGLYSIESNVKKSAQQHFHFGEFIKYLEIDGFYQHYFMIDGVIHGFYSTYYSRSKALRSQTLYNEGIPGSVFYYTEPIDRHRRIK